MKKAILCLSVLLVVLSLAGNLQSAVYSVTSVGSAGARPAAINNNGQIAGSSIDSSVFLYDGTGTHSVVVSNLLEVTGLNSAGDIVGKTSNGGFIWQYGDAAITQPDALQGNSIHVNGINHGTGGDVIVGWSGSDDESTAFSYVAGAAAITPLLGQEGQATAINDAGTIVGQYRSEAGSYPYAIHAYRFNNSFDLGTLGNPNICHSFAKAINADGHTAGYSQTVGPTPEVQGPYHAFLWKGTGMIDLGALTAGTESYANAVNLHDQVVGFSGTSSGPHAFLWDGTMKDLNDLIPEDSGWVLIDATGINDAGQIVGTGTYTYDDNGIPTTENRAFLLTIPEPSTLVLLAVAAAGLLAYAWRRGGRMGAQG